MPDPVFTFRFEATTYKPDGTRDVVTKFDVVKFEGEEQISQPFEYRLTLKLAQPLSDFGKVVNQEAELMMEQEFDDANAMSGRSKSTVRAAGVVSSFRANRQYIDSSTNTTYVEYEAVLVPAFWRLSLFQQSRVFQGRTVQQIITDIFEQEVNPGIPVLGASDYEFLLDETYPPRDFCVQYRESDLDFIQRLMEHEGWYYFYTQDAATGRPKLTITDANPHEPMVQAPKDVNFFEGLGGTILVDDQIYRFHYDRRIVPKKVYVRDYNYEAFQTAEMKFQDTSAPDYARVGAHHEHGLFTVDKDYQDDFARSVEKDSDSNLAAVTNAINRRGPRLARIAQVRAQELEVQREGGQGESNVVRLRAGHRFKFVGTFPFPTDPMNPAPSDFLVTAVGHRYTPVEIVHDKGQTTERTELMTVYRNTFACLPVSIQYRPPRVTPVPRVPGVMTAKVVEELGRPVAPMPPDPTSPTFVIDQVAYDVALKTYQDELKAFNKRVTYEGPVDDEGKYRVELPFAPDPTDPMKGSTSKRVRLAQPYTGDDYGFHFPSRPDSEMVFACIDGDPDRPLGLSMVHNPWMHTPVPTTDRQLGSQNPATGSAAASGATTYDKFKNVIRSSRGHQLVMDDGDAGSNVGITLQVGKAENKAGRDIYWGSKIELGGYRHMSPLERILGIASTAIGYFRSVFTRDFPGMASEALGIIASQVTTDDYVDDTYGTTTPIGVNIWTNKSVNITGKDGVNITSPNLFGMFSTSLFNGDDDSKNQYQAEAISKFIINTVWQEVIDGTADEIMDSKEATDDYAKNKYKNPKIASTFKWTENFKEQRISALIFTLLQRTGVNISSMGELKLTSLQSTSVAAGQGGLVLKSFGNIEQKADLGVDISSHEGIKISTKGRPYKGKGIFKALRKLGDAIPNPGLKAFMGQIQSRFSNVGLDPNEMFPIEINNDDGDILLHTGGSEQKGEGDIMSHVEGKGDIKTFANKGLVHAWSGDKDKGIILEVGSRNGLSGNAANAPLRADRAKGRIAMDEKILHGFSAKKMQFAVGSDYLKDDSAITIEDGSILIKCGQSSIELKKDGTITLKGKSIIQKANTDIKMDALNITSKANGNYKVDASNIKLKATIDATVEGVMFNAKGQLSTVKGSLLKLGS